MSKHAILTWSCVAAALVATACGDSAATTEPPDAAATPDAAAARPDATAAQPDAAVPGPDAAVPHPDSAVPAPDAAVPHPDSAVPAPDAAVPHPDAATPDAGPAAGLSCHAEHLGHLPPGFDLTTPDCDAQPRYLGTFNAAVPPAGGPASFAVNYLWDPARGAFLPRDMPVTVDVAPGAGLAPGTQAFLAVAGGRGHVAPFDFLSLTYAPNWNAFYVPCWDYDCADPVPPYALRARPLVGFRIHDGGDGSYPLGVARPFVLGAGPIKLTVEVIHESEPLPALRRAALTSAFTAVTAWFDQQSRAAGLTHPVAVTIVWTDVDILLPAERRPTDYFSCANADFSDLLPRPADGTLVQVYWANDGTSCGNHFLTATQSIFLFGTPSYPDDDTYVRSLAHELTHLMGASDKYTDVTHFDEEGHPQGCWFADPAVYAERDIMCHRVATFDLDGNFGGFEHPPLRDLVVAPLTAREIGWEDLDGDGVPEAEDACPLDDWCH